jgi:hypothetical protein
MSEKESPGELSLDVGKFASEIMSFLELKKTDLIDNGDPSAAIECWPDPDNEELPEMYRAAKQYEAMLDYAESVTVDDDGAGFPKELADQYDAELAKVASVVNADSSFWERIRAEVMPLYKTGKFEAGPGGGPKFVPNEGPSPWDKRWKSVKVFYDAVGLQVKTTQYMTNKKTGERKKVGVVSDREIPPGFVIKVN